MTALPLVSLVIPAYKADYFEAALASAMAQTYPNMEIVICDDSRTSAIGQVVERLRDTCRFALSYEYNEKQRGETENAVYGVRRSQGKYIKFLHDDDVLHPDCVSALTAAMEANPRVSLASSRRLRLDEQGHTLPDIIQTSFPFEHDVIIDGKQLASFLVDATLNFIGEPSCVLCRREDLLALGERITALNGCVIQWVGDLAMCVRLLRGGDLAFLARPLTGFRVSSQQFSQTGRDRMGIGEKGHEDFRRSIRELGWYTPTTLPRLIQVAPLARANEAEPVDLLARLQAAFKKRAAVEAIKPWIALRKPSATQQVLVDQHLQASGKAPMIEVFILDTADNAMALKRTLASVQSARAHYPRIQGLVLKDIHHINPMLSQSDSPWIMLMAAGEEFTAGGLMVAGLELLSAPDCRAIYGDELWREPSGDLATVLRPDFNLDYLLSFPLAMERHWLFRREVLVKVGGFDVAFAPALEFELILRLINQGGMAGLGHIHETLVVCPAPELQNTPPHFEAIEQHLRLRGYENPVVNAGAPGQYRIDYGHAWQPLVSIIVIMHDGLAAVQRCLMSLLEQTTYAHFEVLIVDNASVSRDSQSWLQAIEKMAPDRIRVLRVKKAMGHAAACNLAAEQAAGEYLVMLRSQAAIVQGEWLTEMLNHGLRQEVGIVGAKGVSGDGTVTHAGLILGLNGAVGSAFTDEKLQSLGYLSRLQVDQNYSAVSDFCVMIRKSVFDEVGGFDAQTFVEQGADFDLCLRAGVLGYLTVWTPRALVMFSEGPARLDEATEYKAYERWLPVLARDPAYNLNFTLHSTTTFDPVDSRISWRPLGWRPLPVVIAHPSDAWGVGNYRVIQPFSGLKNAGIIEGTLCHELLHPADLQRYTPDVIILQRPIYDAQLPLLKGMKVFSNAFKVYELDDYLPNLPLKSVNRQHFPNDVLRSIRRGLACVDRFVVSTQPLAEAFKGLHSDIRVVPNRLDPLYWGNLPVSRRRAGTKPRVGWAGGAGHDGDLALIFDVVKALAGEVEWVFFGGAPKEFLPYATYNHDGVLFSRYPAALAELNLDLALAPLEQNLFNECKSNLRLLEYGICGYPVVCSDVGPYRGDMPVTRVKNRYKDWVEAIRAHLADLEGAARMGDELQTVVRRDWMLDEQGLAAWRAGWLTH